MIARFLDYITIEKRYSKLTVQAYERDLKEFCSFLLATSEIPVRADDFDPTLVTDEDIRSWIIQLLDQGQSARSVRRKISTLRSYWKYLLRTGQTEKDITRVLILPKMDKPLPVFFEEKNIQEALAHSAQDDDYSSVRDSLIIDMLYQTGMRQAELLGLKERDVNTNEMLLRVLGKRNKERLIPFGDKLREHIEHYRAYKQENFQEMMTADAPFLLTDQGRPMTRYTLYNIVRTRMGEASTLKKHSPHVLRHTFATQMLNEGADIQSIKNLMGHASLAATQIYTHTTFEQLKKAYKDAHPRAKKTKNEPF